MTQPFAVFMLSLAALASSVRAGVPTPDSASPGVYPLTLGPIFTTEIILAPSQPGFLSGFGFSVDIEGQIAVAGAPRINRAADPEASVYVFERNAGGEGNWGEERRLVRSGSDSNTFGVSVAVSGDVVVVGAPHLYLGPSTAFPAIPSVSTFQRNLGGTGNWGLLKKLTPADAENEFGFGRFVALEHDTLAVGANRAVYIFERNSGGPNNWGEVKKFVGTDLTGGFSMSGNVIALGGADSRFTNRIYLFERTSAQTRDWRLLKIVHIPGTARVTSYSVDQNALVIGKIDVEGAYIFERNYGGPNNWGESKRLDFDYYDEFIDVAVEKDLVIVAAPNTGKAYVFNRHFGGLNNWGKVQELIGNEAVATPFSNHFGNAVKINGLRAIVGANFAGPGNRGLAYIFEADAPDRDGDGIPDESDACIDSDLRPTVFVGDCDTGVINHLFQDGCTIADNLAGALAAAKNRGKFVSAVAHLLKQWRNQGILSHQQTNAIQRCVSSIKL